MTVSKAFSRFPSSLEGHQSGLFPSAPLLKLTAGILTVRVGLCVEDAPAGKRTAIVASHRHILSTWLSGLGLDLSRLADGVTLHPPPHPVPLKPTTCGPHLMESRASPPSGWSIYVHYLEFFCVANLSLSPGTLVSQLCLCLSVCPSILPSAAISFSSKVKKVVKAILPCKSVNSTSELTCFHTKMSRIMLVLCVFLSTSVWRLAITLQWDSLYLFVICGSLVYMPTQLTAFHWGTKWSDAITKFS